MRILFDGVLFGERVSTVAPWPSIRGASGQSVQKTGLVKTNDSTGIIHRPGREAAKRVPRTLEDNPLLTRWVSVFCGPQNSGWKAWSDKRRAGMGDCPTPLLPGI